MHGEGEVWHQMNAPAAASCYPEQLQRLDHALLLLALLYLRQFVMPSWSICGPLGTMHTVHLAPVEARPPLRPGCLLSVGSLHVSVLRVQRLRGKKQRKSATSVGQWPEGASCIQDNRQMQATAPSASAAERALSSSSERAGSAIALPCARASSTKTAVDT